MVSTTLFLATLLPLVSAHFKLIYPAARGFDEDILGTFPCGGQNTVSSNRTMFPITGAPIQLLMGHTHTNIEVLIAMGNDPGSNFDTIIVPTFSETGPNNFCMGAGAIHFPSNLNITEGMNATIQVITNGDPSGGLYNCADITFTSQTLSQSQYNANCMNSTGVTAAPLTGAAVNANQTTESGSTGGSSSSSASASSGASATGSAAGASSTAKTGAASAVQVGGLAAMAVGAAALFVTL
ncbi:hypothetical protein MBLNU457_3376t1 [Dothideomycetes sp. NU457]